MDQPLPILFIAMSLLVVLSVVTPTHAAAGRPNVILVMTDDQGYGDLGCHGNSMIRTPTLDRLHAQSVRLASFHVDPTCSPTRAALMTGRYSTRAGVWHTIAGRSMLYRDEVTMADVFRAAGYTTGIFGKWHLGDNYPMRPQDRGFDQTLVHGGGGIGQTPDHWGNDYFDDTFLHNGKPEKFTGYCTDIFFDHAIRFVEQNRQKPFFLYVPTNVPHSPYRVPEKYVQRYRDKGVPAPMDSFYGMIENMDENMARLLGRLRELGLEENTLVIWMTDNGTAEGAGRGGAGAAAGGAATWAGFNAGMRGTKGSEYDGGHRVPCFLRWPAGGIGGGRDVKPLTAHIDLLPTLIELCDLKKPEAVAFDGMSLVPLLRGAGANWPQRTLFAHVQRQEIPPKWTRSAVMTDRWRLNNGEALYDILADPGQREDVAAAHPEVVAELRKSYEKWWSGLAPAMERFAHIVIGADQENPAQITCHDWHSQQVPWHHGAIRQAPWANGWWMIEVERAGRYAFTLRQQPAVAKFPIAAQQARVKVGDAEAQAPIPPGADAVTVTLDLKAGPARLETWLTDTSVDKSRGAFFVEVRRLD